MAGSEDQKLIEQLNAASEEAYKLLFDRYFYSLSSFTNHYLEDANTSEDVVQDVFFNFWLQKKKFQDIVALKTYLYRSARNKALDLIKHNKVHTRFLTAYSAKEDSDYFIHRLLEEEVYLELRKAVDELPPQTRQVYDLVLLGYDNRQVAQMLDTTVDSVKSHRKRGKQLIREKLKNMMQIVMPLF